METLKRYSQFIHDFSKVMQEVNQEVNITPTSKNINTEKNEGILSEDFEKISINISHNLQEEKGNSSNIDSMFDSNDSPQQITKVKNEAYIEVSFKNFIHKGGINNVSKL